jgi:hypothetical protein
MLTAMCNKFGGTLFTRDCSKLETVISTKKNCMYYLHSFSICTYVGINQVLFGWKTGICCKGCERNLITGGRGEEGVCIENRWSG